MSNGRWFRFYDEALNDPKVQKLSGDMFKAWVNLLCIASKNDGRIPVEDVAFSLRMDPADVVDVIVRFTQLDLLTAFDGYYEPHNWSGRQYKSDNSDPTNAERQARYREKHKQGSNAVTPVTVTATRAETDTKTDTEQNKSSGADAPNGGKRKREKKYATAISENFEPNWEAATRVGLSRREAEREVLKFKNHAAQTGRTCVNWQAAWSNWCINAAQFLKRPPPGHSTQTAQTITPASRSWNAWKAHFRDTNDNIRAVMMDKCGDEGRPFTVLTEWPPGHEMNNAA